MAPLLGAFHHGSSFLRFSFLKWMKTRRRAASRVRPGPRANATGCYGQSSASRRRHHRLAADEPRELAQPHEYALPRERLEAVIEAQQQSAALDHHRRLRQHAGGGGRDEIGDAQRSAEHARAVEHAGRDEFAQSRREFLVNQADMAEEDGERDGGGAGGGGVGVCWAFGGRGGGGRPRRRWRGRGPARGPTRRSSAVSSSPEDAMKQSVQAINSSPWAGERERSTLSSLAAAISGSFARSSASSIE